MRFITHYYAFSQLIATGTPRTFRNLFLRKRPMNKILFALIATASTLSIAHAEGAYVGAGVIGSRHTFDVPGAISSDSKSGNKLSGKVFGGYDLDKTWSIEGGYADLGSSSYSYSDAAGAMGHLDASSHSFYGAAKGTIPLNEQFGLFGKLGVARNHVSVNGTGAATSLTQIDDKTDLYAAVGGQYNLNKKVALTVEYERFGKNNDLGNKASAISAGARYNF